MVPTMRTDVAEPPTPSRPDRPLSPPPWTARFEVEVEAAHLANPLVAVSRLLVSEAAAFAHVAGDEHHLSIEVALAGPGDEDREAARSWVRWAVHNAGVRGRVVEVAAG